MNYKCKNTYMKCTLLQLTTFENLLSKYGGVVNFLKTDFLKKLTANKKYVTPI